MTDLATLGIRVEGQEVVTADAQLDGLAASAARAETATDKLASAARGSGAAMMTMNTAVRQQSVVLGAARAGMGLTAAEGMNLSRQFADIGVTAAMGMNPLMIALQQGPQLLDIFQTAAIRTGQTTSQVARQMAVAWMEALWPILPIIAAIAAAAGLMASALALSARSINAEFGDLTRGMGLTEKQLENVKNRGVTMGDVLVGTFRYVRDTISDVLGPYIEKIGEWFSTAADVATRAWVAALKFLVGGFLGAYRAVTSTWSQLPAALGDIAVTTANAVIHAMETMVNKSIVGINTVVGAAKALGSIPGFSAFSVANLIPTVGPVSFGEIDNPNAGAARRAGRDFAAEFASGMAEGGPAVDRELARLQESILGVGRDRIRGEGGEDTARQRAGGSARAGQAPREVLAPLGRINLDPLNTRVPEITTHLELMVAELRLVDDLAQDAARGMASAFGETGRALGDLMTTMTQYQSRLADIALAEQEHRLTAAQADRKRSMSQMQNYGDMAAAARGFFKEGSDGYQALMAVEQVYRAFQFASMIQSMALGGQETAASIANSLARGAASAAAGAARMFEFLGPFAFPAVAAMLALLVGLGISNSGGGGSKPSTAANDNDPNTTTDAVRAMSAREANGRDAAASAVASRIEVAVTADRDGLNAYVVSTAQREAVGVAAPMVAAAAAGTKKDVFETLRGQQAGNRRITG